MISIILSCGKEKPEKEKKTPEKRLTASEAFVPVDKGFSEFISAYTSGVISVNSPVEIHFTPEFAAKANKKTTAGLISFEPVIKGKTEWIDETTLMFRPDKILSPATIYKGSLNIGKLAEVPERLQSFPLQIRTLKRDFIIRPGALECTSPEGNTYILHGELIASDHIPSDEIERCLEARLEKKKPAIAWDHSDRLVHKFTIANIDRTSKQQNLEIKWDGSGAGIRQKGSASFRIPPAGEFSVINLLTSPAENQKIDIVFSDPVDPGQELEGLIWFSSGTSFTASINQNIITIFPAERLSGEVDLAIEASVKKKDGVTLPAPFVQRINFSPVKPSIALAGRGVILPSSKNLIFPFKAVNLKAVDLKIIKIFENNLPYFLQENDINAGYSFKRFGRPVFQGRIDLAGGTGTNKDIWNLYTIDLSEYINVEPGILYRIELSMRPSYSIYTCTGDMAGNYEQLLDEYEERTRGYWDDPENYYDDSDDMLYYSMGFDWRDREDPCKEAYFSPDKKVTRNILASNIGIIAKKGTGSELKIFANDLLTALPLSEVTVEIYDYQLQKIVSGSTNQDGELSLSVDRKPFLLIAKKDKDRNYLKINESSSLPLSSFDVSGVTPENGIKVFITGERDVWRPGDSIFLSLFLKDLSKELPSGHPVIFELKNPLNQRVDNQVMKLNEQNILVFKTKTLPDAITGNYTATFRIGGADFTKRIRIETVKPNRLKINLTFPQEILQAEKSVKGTLNAKWLNGAIAANMKSSVDYILKHTKTSFDKYRQYQFDDPATEFYAETVNIFDGTTDDVGNAALTFDAGKKITAPGMLDAVFTAKVMEKGGDESITQTSLRFSPYPVYAGINIPALKGNDRMLFTDREYEIKAVTLDPAGNPVRSAVEMNIYKISYRWWWESDNENLAYYISNNIYKPVVNSRIVTTNGEGTFKFTIGRNDWGRYLIRLTTPGGHSTGKIVLIDWPWEYGFKGEVDGATVLQISTDKEKYKTGEEVKLSFPSPENSRAFITIENATSVIEEIRTPSTKGNTTVTFRARPEMAPNVYAYVTVIQPHSQTVNDMPIRLYGVIPVMIEDPETHLEPVITVAEEVRSQRPFEIKISEADKKPMNYTLAVVDEGLLDITGFKTPDPWSYFYAREALGVKTWDLYDLVLGAFGGTLDRIFAVGGDETVIDKSASKALRFFPVVKFLGPFKLPAGKTASHTVVLPQYTGSVKVMVVAGNDRSYGSSGKSVLVRDPLMVLATAPRTLSPGEKVTLPVTLFVNKETIRNITIDATGNELVSFDDMQKNITVTGTGETDTGFSFTAGEKTGIAKISVKASGGNETAEYKTEIDIRNPNPTETRSEMKLLKQGEKWETTFIPFGMKGSDEAFLEASSLPSVNLEKRLGYLVSYPHGCTEQIISAAFPQLWLKSVSGNDEKTLPDASENIKEAVNKLAGRQMNNGGIVLWPQALQPDNWVTSYACHFMVEAERAGYVIPSSFRQKLIDYQKNISREWRFDPKFKQSAIDQSYRLFTLALAGQPERGAMNRLRESEGLPQLSRWLLAAAFAVTGRSEAAAELLDVRNSETESNLREYYYGSYVRDKAIILYTLTILKREEEALQVLDEICRSLNSEEWFSTQSLAWGLFSYMKFAEMVPGTRYGPSKFSMEFNGEPAQPVIQTKQIWRKSLSIRDGNNSLRIENSSDKPLYFNLIRKAIPLPSDMSVQEKGLSMKVNYYSYDLSPLDPKVLQQGTNFMMVVKVTNTSFSNVQNIALTQMIPSGWEISNTRLFEEKRGIEESSFDYRDIRDDRVNTYFSLNMGETKTFVILLNAAYMGEFCHPSVWCEAMYTENCYSRHPGFFVKVTGQ